GARFPGRPARPRGRRGAHLDRDGGRRFSLLRRVCRRRRRGPGPVAFGLRARRARIPTSGGPAMRVLVVEDEEKIAQFLKKGLTEKGYAVELAGDADTALQRIESLPMDLIILDLLLPGSRDGLELCRQLRARGVRAKILMLTARDTVENKIEGLDAGA